MDYERTRERLECEIVAVRARLVALDVELGAIHTASIDANTDDEHDPEGSTIAFERARVASLRAKSGARLIELDQARLRLDSGCYARCTCCGAEISADRIAALPAVTTCISCATSPLGSRVRRAGTSNR